MKLKKVKLVIESRAATKRRWAEALGGKVRSPRGVEVISIASWDILDRILSAPRMQILSAIPTLQPTSISALAKALKKDFKNVHSDVKFLAELGLLELREEGTRGNLMPVAKFSGIEFGLAAA